MNCKPMGYTHKQIGKKLGRGDRTISTWLKQVPLKRKKLIGKVRLMI
jgi:transposase